MSAHAEKKPRSTPNALAVSIAAKLRARVKERLDKAIADLTEATTGESASTDSGDLDTMLGIHNNLVAVREDLELLGEVAS